MTINEILNLSKLPAQLRAYTFLENETYVTPLWIKYTTQAFKISCENYCLYSGYSDIGEDFLLDSPLSDYEFQQALQLLERLKGLYEYGARAIVPLHDKAISFKLINEDILQGCFHFKIIHYNDLGSQEYVFILDNHFNAQSDFKLAQVLFSLMGQSYNVAPCQIRVISSANSDTCAPVDLSERLVLANHLATIHRDIHQLAWTAQLA